MSAPLPLRSSLSSSAPFPSANDEVGKGRLHLAEFLGILLDNKGLITAVTSVGLLVGGAYALIAPPVYEANLLIQVEDSKGAATSILGEASSLFDVKTPAAGEIEIIRSRMVIGAAVENTRLFIEAEPMYLPLIGRWLSSRATQLSEPGAFGWTGYVRGTEEIVVPHLELPTSWVGSSLVLTAGEGGLFSLEHEDLAKPLQGRVGTMQSHMTPAGEIQILVASLNGRPGAQFVVKRSSRLAAIESLQARLQLAEKGRQSGVINATLEDTDSARLATVLNEIGHQYVRQNIERKAAEAQKTLDFLDEQLPQYKKEQEDAERLYNRYRNQKGTVAFDEEAKLVLKQTVDLQTKLLEARQQRRELEARFTKSHPSLQTLDSQIAAWSREIESLNARVRQMPQIQQDALRMERDVRVNTEMYQSLLNSSLQLSLVKEGKIGNVRLIDEAVAPETPVRPKVPFTVALSLALGFLSGIGLSVLRSSFMHGLRDPSEVEAKTGLNVFSTIPLSPEQDALAARIASKKPGIHSLTISHPTNPAIESLRSLRTALQFAMLEAPDNRVVITGATPGVGKTFISVNFSTVMAAGGKKIVLIDADLRKGHINQYLGLKRENGLSELIAGTLPIEKAVHQDVVPGLDVITTGSLPPNPAELLMSDSFSRILQVLSSQYDLVIIDTPPVLVAADTVAVAPHAGTILLVARADKTYAGELEESAKRLSHAGRSVAGVLFNALDATRRQYGTYGYKYGSYRYTQYAYESNKAE